MIYRFLPAKDSTILEDHLKLGERNEKEEIKINSLYLSKNEKPWIPVMGEFHYTRVKRENWTRELAKMKAGGITIVSTYVIWIYHEEEEDQFCFTEDNDISAFLRICQKLELSVMLRIGPWVHGEIRNGGFPDWLIKKDIPLRNSNSEYIGYVKRYLEHIYQEVKDFLFKNNGCIVGIQLENELVDDADYLLRLKELTIEIGLVAPIYTVTGWNAKYGAKIPENDVIPVFGGYPEAPWTDHTKKLEPSSNYFFVDARNDSSIGADLIACEKPDTDTYYMKYERYPYATCELGGGIQVTWKRRPVISGDDVAAIALVKLGCGNNLPGYYMYHGGTNQIGTLSTLQESKDTGYPNDYPIRSYDFQAAIGEYGQIREQYRKLKLQHLFLQDMGNVLAPMKSRFQAEAVVSKEDKSTLRYCARTDGESGFVYVNNYERLEQMKPHEDAQFEVSRDTQAGTEIMVFPEGGMRIKGGSYFILPFWMDMDGILLKYATAQFIFHQETTWFFFSPPDDVVEYAFDHQKITVIPGIGSSVIILDPKEKSKWIRIVTLTTKEAEHLYRFGQTVMISSGDLYEWEGNVVCYQERSNQMVLYIWNGDKFIEQEELVSRKTSSITWKEITDWRSCTEFPDYLLREHYLENQKQKNLRCYQITLDRSMYDTLEDAYMEITYSGDVAQIYIDNNLVADDFCMGASWRVSIKSIFQEKGASENTVSIYLLISNLCNNIYLERTVDRIACLKDISFSPVYRIEFPIAKLLLLFK